MEPVGGRAQAQCPPVHELGATQTAARAPPPAGRAAPSPDDVRQQLGGRSAGASLLPWRLRPRRPGGGGRDRAGHGRVRDASMIPQGEGRRRPPGPRVRGGAPGGTRPPREARDRQA